MKSNARAVVVCTLIRAWNLWLPMRPGLRLNKENLSQLTACVTVSVETDPAKVVAVMAKAW